MQHAGFIVFLALTVLFAVVLMFRCLPLPSARPRPQQKPQRTALESYAAQTTSPDFKAIADAITSILAELENVGQTLDKLGPTAIVGVFTMFFAGVTVIFAALPVPK